MLRKLFILFLLPVVFAFAYDVSVSTATTDPSPALLNQNNFVKAIVALDEPGAIDIPIHGRIEFLQGTTSLLEEDFEGETFPPTDWDIITTNTDTVEGHLCTWFRGDVEASRHHDNAGAYVWFSDNPSNEWLITPGIDLSGISEEDRVELIFNSSYTPTLESEIHHYVLLSLDGGTTWTDTLLDVNHVEVENPTLEPVFIDDEPNPFSIDLSGYIGDTITIGFNYYLTAEGFKAVQTLDDIKIVVKDYDALWTDDDTISVPGPSGQTSFTHTFNAPWSPDSAGIFRLRVWTSYEQDRDPSNDMFVGKAYAGVTVDLGITQIMRPAGVEAPNEAFVPQCVVENSSANPCNGIVRCRIDEEGGPVYIDSAVVALDTGYTNVSMKAFVVGELGSAYTAHFAVENAMDADSSNNAQSRSFVAGYLHSIVPVGTISPTENDTIAASFNPQASYMNQGIFTESDWFAIVRIVDMTEGGIWSDTVHMLSEILPEEAIDISFDQFTPVAEHEYRCTFSALVNTEGFGSQNLDVPFFGGQGSDIAEDVMPKEYSLGVLNNFSSNVVTINYAMPKSGHLSLKAYDVSGKLVVNLVEEPVPAGYGKFTMETQKLATGLYFVRMEANDFSATRKLILVR